jgi:hypothetical protein
MRYTTVGALGAIGALAVVLGSAGTAAAGSGLGVSLHVGGVPYGGYGVVHVGSRYGHHDRYDDHRGRHRRDHYRYSYNYGHGGYRYVPRGYVRSPYVPAPAPWGYGRSYGYGRRDYGRRHCD